MNVSRLGRLPWHPLLLAAAVVLTAWLEAAVSPFAAFRALAVALLIAAALTAGAALATRSWQLGGIAASAVLALLWSRQLADLAFGVIERAGPVVAVIWLILIVAVAALGIGLVRKRARSWSRDDVGRFLNRAGALLVVATLALGVINGRLIGLAADLRQGVELDAWAGSGEVASDQPDIYAILLDGYPRADVLDYAFGIDNGPFLASLEERGFGVATASHSDYLWTHVSVPSALNLAYVEQIPAMRDVIEGRVARQPTLRRTITGNVAFDMARAHGYSVVAVASGFEEVAPRQADVYVDGGQLNEFEISLLASTFTGDLVNVIAPDFASGQLRARVLYDLEALPRIAATRDRPPVLVYAHVPAPHQPVVFGADGAPVAVPITSGWFADSPSERGQDPDEFQDRYRAQLPYLNERILETIDGILANSEVPPVIVLFADHGSASVVDWNQTDPDEADPARVLERTGILFAALTPEREGVFPDDISPVDLFRLLFDAYFGMGYGRATPPTDGGHVPPVDASVLDD
jgi:hypothetical protein